MNIKGYDEWLFREPRDEMPTYGIEDGQECGRYPEPDEDAPRNWRPRPCGGTMVEGDGVVACDRCGETA